jgi:3-oxoacid CoA-transferase subunit A
MNTTRTKADKVYADAAEALFDLRDGASIMSGGFGLCGIPENSISEIHRRGVRDLTVISNNCGNMGMGLAVLLKTRQVRKVICSYVGGNPDLEEQMLKGEVEVELNPQGTFAERIRAGGHGIAGFYTPTGVGTVVAEGKEVRDFDGVPHLLETALRADFAIVKARRGDAMGNLVFHEAARNFSPLMATAGRVTVAEVEELVPVGDIDPNDVHVPGIFVQRIFQGRDYLNTIEKMVLRDGVE